MDIARKLRPVNATANHEAAEIKYCPTIRQALASHWQTKQCTSPFMLIIMRKTLTFAQYEGPVITLLDCVPAQRHTCCLDATPDSAVALPD